MAEFAGLLVVDGLELPKVVSEFGDSLIKPEGDYLEHVRVVLLDIFECPEQLGRLLDAGATPISGEVEPQILELQISECLFFSPCVRERSKLN